MCKRAFRLIQILLFFKKILAIVCGERGRARKCKLEEESRGKDRAQRPRLAWPMGFVCAFVLFVCFVCLFCLFVCLFVFFFFKLFLFFCERSCACSYALLTSAKNVCISFFFFFLSFSPTQVPTASTAHLLRASSKTRTRRR